MPCKPYIILYLIIQKFNIKNAKKIFRVKRKTFPKGKENFRKKGEKEISSKPKKGVSAALTFINR